MTRRSIIYGSLFAFLGTATGAEPPADVLEFFRASADALANEDAKAFLDHFDSGMPGYAVLRDEIESILASKEVGTTIEVLSDEGDEHSRVLELDWLLLTNDRDDINASTASKRAVIKCKIERKGKQWKITALDPIDFFKL